MQKIALYNRQKLQSFLQPKIMERLLKFLPTTFIKVLNGVCGGWGAKNNRGPFFVHFLMTKRGQFQRDNFSWSV